MKTCDTSEALAAAMGTVYWMQVTPQSSCWEKGNKSKNDRNDRDGTEQVLGFMMALSRCLRGGVCLVTTAVAGQRREGRRLFVVIVRGGGEGRVRSNWVSPTVLIFRTRKYKHTPWSLGWKVLKAF